MKLHLNKIKKDEIPYTTTYSVCNNCLFHLWVIYSFFVVIKGLSFD